MNAYLIIFILLFFSITLSFLELFDYRNNDNYVGDLYPKSQDCTLFKKMVWYFSQVTYQIQLLLAIYFGMRLLGYKNDIFYKMIAAPSLLVSVQYFLLLNPKIKLKDLHKFTYCNIISHLFNSLIILMELKSIKTFRFIEAFYCFPIIIISLLIIQYNYSIRKIWTYNLLNIKTKLGKKKLLSSISMTLLLSLILMFIHKNINII